MKKICVGVCILLGILVVGQVYATEPLQPMTIQLSWVPNVESAGIILAKEQGWYKEAGIDLTIKGWEEGISPIDEVITERAQIGVISGADLIKARTEGITIKAIATALQRSPYCLMSKKEQGIETPDQLAGKRIGFSALDSVLMTEIVLKSQGLQLDDIIPVELAWDLQPFIDDEVDVYAAFMNDEPLTIREQGYDVTYIPAFKYGYDFYSYVYFTTETMIQQNPGLVRKFLEVTLRGWREAFKNPVATTQLVIEKYYPEGSVSQQIESLKLWQMLATLGVGDNLIGYMQERIWAKGIDILYEYQQIDKKIPAGDLFTLEFLKK